MAQDDFSPDRWSQLRERWRERSPAERRALSLGAGLVALAIVWLLAIDPAVRALSDLGRKLPGARARAAELAAVLAEARELRQLRPAAAGADVRGMLEKSLQDAGLAPARNRTLDTGQVQYSFKDVSWARWTGWLSVAERDLGVRAVAVHAAATATPGNADVEVTLGLPHG